MSIFSKYISPRLMNMFMSVQVITPYRAELLQYAQGKILEIGFGSGLNLPHYPAGVREIDIVEINEGMKNLAQKNIAQSTIQVNYHTLNAELLPFPAATFDTVVSAWTLCSIAEVSRALAEIYRVLKPDGQFLFAEHGLSNEPQVQKWQHRLTPIQKIIADGCHLDRNIEALIAEAGFKFRKLRKEYAGSPKVASYFYIGVATKAIP
ncbi:SAM-dependent methyltransferase [Adhaeribacter arboris]|uniref:SAM-dependent methyltransferase n=1 Tax=Adhaeribacter arboris TaxID=2072846 RepID=A0A2T2YAV5_9BACT|nr:class I SAM-dependent methyltransferase [Adhaeribacter arboris]PSR52660.1 SAM-dependent methyltransferase [Adhaeribacter arboris]